MMKEILSDMEQTLHHNKPWLLGEQYTLVDIWCMVMLARLATFGKNEWWEGGKLPHVESYYLRLRERPSFVEGDVWEGIRPAFMMRMLAPFVLPRLAAATVVLGLIVAGVWWLFQ